MINDLKPGKVTCVNKSLSNHEYHSSKGVSASGARLLLDCPARYYHKYLLNDTSVDEEESKALRLGKLLHTLTLEPEEFDTRYFVLPEELDRRTKDGKERWAFICSTHAGKIFIKSDEFTEAKRMAFAIAQHPQYRKYFATYKGKKYIEQSYFKLVDSDVYIKTRPDYHIDPQYGVIIDIKTTESVKEENFIRSVFKYGYDIQAALGLDILSSYYNMPFQKFIFIAVEKKPPYLTASYTLSDAILQIGHDKYHRAIGLYKKCIAESIWQGYEAEEKLVQLQLPHYMEKYYDNN